MSSRREVLKTIAVGGAAVPALRSQHAGHTPVQIEKSKAPREPKFFSKADYALVGMLVDHIIPRTDTPGAKDAGVDYLIDQSVLRSAIAQKEWKSGLAWIKQQKFPDLDHAAQVAVLTKAMNDPESRGGRFFKLLKAATVDAYYSTREGLSTELGWNANTFLAEFKGCTHPEHQS